jgi:hypothetical protein
MYRTVWHTVLKKHLIGIFFNKRRVCDFCYSELKQGQGEQQQQQQQQHCVLEEEGQQDHKNPVNNNQEGSATSKPNGLLSVAVPPQEGKHAVATAAATAATAAATAATAATGEEDDEDEDVVTEICDNLEVDKQTTG